MKTKIHAKVDADTVQLLQRVREISGYAHYDEMIKFMATLTVASYLEARAQELSNVQETQGGISQSDTGAISNSSEESTSAR